MPTRGRIAPSLLAFAVGRTDGELTAVLMHQSFISLALLIATLLVAGFFAYIYSIKRQNYLLLWTSGWFIFGLHYLAPAASPSTLSTPLETALSHWLYSLSGLLFFLGAQIYSQKKPWKFSGWLSIS
jgi:FtsH-binding integral membrane protein